MKRDICINQLEILIITYNRAPKFDYTLQQLSKSPFKKCRITVLDNCSTDNTAEICVKYKRRFPHFNIIRHKKNIGGGANYLRAVELSESEYTWILCDDDHYDFSDCDDMIQAIESRKYDIISVGGGDVTFSHRGCSTTSQELIQSGEMYYTMHTFIPSMIYRTALFDSECISKGYFIMNDLYPQFIFVNASVEKNFSVYITKNEILLRDPDNDTHNLNPFFHFTSWVNNCLLIKNKSLRRRVIYERFKNKKVIFILKLVYYIYFEKVLIKQGRLDFGKEGVFKKYGMLFFGFCREQVLILILLAPLLFVPAFVFRVVGKIVFIIYYKGNIPADKDPSISVDQRI